jgi:hypothetical protein
MLMSEKDVTMLNKGAALAATSTINVSVLKERAAKNLVISYAQQESSGAILKTTLFVSR